MIELQKAMKKCSFQKIKKLIEQDLDMVHVNILDRAFKITIIQVLKDSVEKVDNKHKKVRNFSKEKETMAPNEDALKERSLSELKGFPVELTTRLDTAKEQRALENTSVKIT